MKDDKALGRWAGAGRGLCLGWCEAPLRETCTVRRSQGTTGRKSAQAEGRACSKALRPGTQGLRDRRPVWLGGGGRRKMWEVGKAVCSDSVTGRSLDFILSAFQSYGFNEDFSAAVGAADGRGAGSSSFLHLFYLLSLLLKLLQGK